MKKLIIGCLLTLAATANAQYPHHRHGGWGYGWVAPTVIGGVVGYEIARSQQPVIVQPSVIVQPPQQTIIVPSPAPAGYHWAQMVDPACNCYKLVLAPN